jgi:hypothetical protein
MLSFSLFAGHRKYAATIAVFLSPSPSQPLLGAMFAAQWGSTFVGSTSSGGSDVSGRLERCQTVD